MLRGRVEVGRADAGGGALVVFIDEGAREGANLATATLDGQAVDAAFDAICGTVAMPVDGRRVTLLPDAAGDACLLGVRAPGRPRVEIPVTAAAAPGRLARGVQTVVTWEEPEAPVAGRNTVRLRVFDRATRAPIDAATLNVYPYMDMGGGEGHSTPFRTPVALGGGRFDVEIDFVMSGRWDLTVYVNPGSGPAETTVLRGYYVVEP